MQLLKIFGFLGNIIFRLSLVTPATGISWAIYIL